MHPTIYNHSDDVQGHSLMINQSAAAQQCAFERAISMVFCLGSNIIHECFAKMLLSLPAIGHGVPLDHKPRVADREPVMRTRPQ